ncbi:MAG: putative exonuclease [Prokaryotic dsDNA virus sp.]|nr:MAG: putative exonuclease [Prokaryotic dsDNA virus sp.]|tara:strand:- start:1743 stop:2360 length:618 start_codon:yes stop_codon:yes gene_type:complete
MLNIIDVDQGTEEWFQARLGKWTASFFSKALTNTGKESSKTKEVNSRLVAELLVGEPDETFQSDAMLRGKELESDALDFLNFTQNLNLKPCGFVDSGEGYGCSPDALDLDNSIGLELKCPLPHTHLEYLVGDKLPVKYTAQVQGSMAVTGFKKWIFMSYHPTIKPLVVTVERDEEYIKNLLEILRENCKEVSERYEKLKNDNVLI